MNSYCCFMGLVCVLSSSEPPDRPGEQQLFVWTAGLELG